MKLQQGVRIGIERRHLGALLDHRPERAHRRHGGRHDLAIERRAPAMGHQRVQRRGIARLGVGRGEREPLAEGLLEGLAAAVGPHHQVGPVAGAAAIGGGRRHGSGDQATHEHRRLVGPPPQLADRRRWRVVDDLDGRIGLRQHRSQQPPPQGSDLWRHGIHAGIGDHVLSS